MNTIKWIYTIIITSKRLDLFRQIYKDLILSLILVSYLTICVFICKQYLFFLILSFMYFALIIVIKDLLLDFKKAFQEFAAI